MKFGKVYNLKPIDFHMPEPPLATEEWLDELPDPVATPEVYFGCTGWGMKEWVGSYYPSDAKSKEYLRHYARQFTTIELNTTHYRIPTPALVNQWHDMATGPFKFSPKIPQSISHSRDLGMTGEQIGWFCDSIVGLREKLGISFMQLPPTFKPERMDLLAKFLERFPLKRVPLAIEVRHEQWFSDKGAYHAYLDLLRSHQASTVITDVAGRRDVLHMGITTPYVLIRFVGNSLHETDYQRVDDWVTQLVDWLERGVQEVYFFSHQPDNILSPEMCEYFIAQLEARSEYQFLKKPSPLGGEQMALF